LVVRERPLLLEGSSEKLDELEILGLGELEKLFPPLKTEVCSLLEELNGEEDRGDELLEDERELDKELGEEENRPLEEPDKLGKEALGICTEEENGEEDCEPDKGEKGILGLGLTTLREPETLLETIS